MFAVANMHYAGVGLVAHSGVENAYASIAQETHHQEKSAARTAAT
jgi:hypothetical protein